MYTLPHPNADAPCLTSSRITIAQLKNQPDGEAFKPMSRAVTWQAGLPQVRENPQSYRWLRRSVTAPPEERFFAQTRRNQGRWRSRLWSWGGISSV